MTPAAGPSINPPVSIRKSVPCLFRCSANVLNYVHRVFTRPYAPAPWVFQGWSTHGDIMWVLSTHRHLS